MGQGAILLSSDVASSTNFAIILSRWTVDSFVHQIFVETIYT